MFSLDVKALKLT